MHDWSYYLGFTEVNSNLQRDNFGNTQPGPFPVGREVDPEVGQAQAGHLTGTVNPAFGRDNANQITLQDGLPGITNQYLWQPIANAVYVPCVDGAYDVSVAAHEYGHAIQHRMTAGPNQGLVGHQARSMGESWSDLTAVEYLNGYGFVPIADENPFAVGPYVTGDPQRGVRNYGMDDSPLNYSNVGYDFVGPQVHADGEIWSALNFAIREALIAKYDNAFPAGDQRLQTRCADGRLPADACPGNRRWIQLMHDGFLLQPSATSMIDSRDALLAADLLRFGGENQAELWAAFARHGLGEGASSEGTNDTAPVPDFSSPLHDNATVTFVPAGVGDGPVPDEVEVFVGHYEARSRPVAVTGADDTAEFVAGTYELVARADGFGHLRFTETFEPGEAVTVEVAMAENLASLHAGAEVASGDGVNRERLLDDTEATNWASLGSEGTASAPGDVAGRQVTVALAGDEAQRIDRVQVSAMLRPTDSDDEDSEAQNRFSALRAFDILVCDATAGSDCDDEGDFTLVLASPDDAFPSVPLRPRAPDLILRAFVLDEAVDATHVRLRVRTNQCTGVEEFQGELDRDPTNETDCVEGAGAGGLIPPQGENVRAAALQVFAAPDNAADRPGRARRGPPAGPPGRPGG
jgi:extracellular elastinolytic metalloproteinase